MRKKWLAIGLSVGISGALVWGIGVSASAENAGLEVYKSALNQTKEAKSMTANAHLELTDNGTKLLTLDGVAKVNHDEKMASLEATYTGAKGEGSLQAFREPDQVIVKKGDSDIYQVMETMDWGHKFSKNSEDRPPAMVNHLFKPLFGNMDKWTTVENLPDGRKRASLELSEEQMPAFVKVMGPTLYSKLTERSQAAAASEKGIAVKLPNLEEHFQVDQILLQATIDEQNRIERQAAEVHVSGVDASGEQHALLLSLDIRLSDLAATTPDSIDLTGKQVEKISREEMKSRWKKDGWNQPVSQ
ncbi:hypothetical protein [Brevibacillus sp. NRS-1366]|uniref:hypothetical protein n=1 Tax=Brevibacillus sp. NRS-1366 TaxID=3233899 RepID=UPI003D1A97E8